MKYYYAPMEGITGYLHRSVYHSLFDDIDKYFAPFIVPNQNRKLSGKERRDLLPENNQGMNLIPQILTNRAEDYLAYEDIFLSFGYKEININLGCPSKTVVSKYRGSGFLAKPEELDAFLEKIFTDRKCRISIKTRVGKDSEDEFPKLLEIYNKYPLEELIIHPRTQKDMYKNTPNIEMYEYAVKNSRNPVCYNGDIFGPTAYRELIEQFPGTEAIMLGRGLLINPGLICVFKDGEMVDKKSIRKYHDRMYEAYIQNMSGEKVILFKMKELWVYLHQLFSNSEKYAKKIRKAQKLYAYESAVNELFDEQELILYDERRFRIK
ncbi:MAG: tRNA-dihydrouridine synthase family protein [Eubacteriales bacterium]|nr:tRNA-dihydrouridine synthase family protein [Eubacteriales bacterium]